MVFASTIVAVAGFLAAAPAALATITINGPSASAYWVQGTTNFITWTFNQGDPNPIDIVVTNPNSTFLNGGFSIARNVNLSNGTFTVTNVTLNVHSGYVVNFVNDSNPTQVFAQSGAFDVRAPGTPPAPQATSGASPTGTSSSGNSTGNGTATSSGASGKPTNGSSSGGNSNAAPHIFDSSFMSLAPMLGISITMAMFGALVTL